MAIKLYFGDVPEEGDRSPANMQELIKNAMEQVKKEHYLTFYKHLLVCDWSMGSGFLLEIQTHYDNPKLEMLIVKLQMLVYSSMNKEQKVSWLRQCVTTLALDLDQGKGLRRCRPRVKPGDTFHAPKSVGECERMNLHIPK
jgi:hypothetical protein